MKRPNIGIHNSNQQRKEIVMKRIFYRFKDDIYIDYGAVYEIAKELGVERSEIAQLELKRSLSLNNLGNRLIHIN